MTSPVIVTAVTQLPRDFAVPDELARDLRRADVFIRMAVTSAFSVISTIKAEKLEPEETGIFIGTAYGPLETNFESLGSLIDDGEGQISPTLFSHSVYNAAAGYVARLLDIRGPAITITNYGWPFLIALEEARLAVASGRIKRAVVIGVETYSALLADAYKRFFNVAAVPWERGAAAWVLESGGKADGFCCLQGIKINEYNAEASDLLTRRGETFIGSNQVSQELPRHSMAYVTALSKAVMALTEFPQQSCCWSLKSSFGRAEVVFCK